MLTDLLLRNVRGLKYCELRQLDRVNVICGKNNSGKSTLLNAIALEDVQHCAAGCSMSRGELESIYERVIAPTQFAAGKITDGPNQRYLGAIESVVNTRSIWFESDETDFVSELRLVRGKDAWLRSQAFREEQAAQGFAELFRPKPAAVYLPPKRNLDIAAPINASQRVEAGGAGILNRLFYCKNQESGADGYKHYALIAAAFSQISSGYDFDVFLSMQNQLALRFRAHGGVWMPAEHCGLGLHDLLAILFFALDFEHDVLLIEEPESHMHPDMQRKLLQFLRESTEKQYFIATHSNIFLNNALVDRVFTTTYLGEVQVSDVTSRASALDDLGYSVADNLVSDAVVLVEGPKDVPVIEELMRKLRIDKDFDIRIWPLGGDIMDQVDLNVFSQAYKIFALVDADPGSQKVRDRFVKKCRSVGIAVHKLERYAVENYYTVRALREVFGSQIPVEFSVVDPKKKLEVQIGLNAKNSSRRIVREMTLDEFEGTDLLEFMKKIDGSLRGASPSEE